jgi:predicted Zn-dependent peptidase
MQQGDHFLQAELPNGVQVVGEPMAGVESAGIGLLFGAGARDEAPETAGISHFTEQLLFRGTERRDERQISEQFDYLGASYDASAGIEMTMMSSRLIGSRMLEAVDLLIDCARSPIFPSEAVESVRALQQGEIRQRQDSPAQQVMDGVRRELFAGHPLSNDVLGTEASVEHVTREDLITYHRRLYHTGNMLVSIAGNFDWERLIDRLEQATLGWESGGPRPPAGTPEPRAAVEVLDKQDASQEHLGFAFPGVPASDPRFFAAALMAQALGGGTNSRLHREVREKRGLAYAAQARFDGMQTTGLVRIYVGTSPDRAPESVDVVLAELRVLEQSGIEADELDRAKTRLKSQTIMRSESTYARMGANLRSWWMERRLYSLDEVKERIDAITRDDILSLVRDLHIGDTVAAVAVGPRSREDLFNSAALTS